MTKEGFNNDISGPEIQPAQAQPVSSSASCAVNQSNDPSLPYDVTVLPACPSPCSSCLSTQLDYSGHIPSSIHVVNPTDKTTYYLTLVSWFVFHSGLLLFGVVSHQFPLPSVAPPSGSPICTYTYLLDIRVCDSNPSRILVSSLSCNPRYLFLG
jgi:hypothetical protein